MWNFLKNIITQKRRQEQALVAFLFVLIENILDGIKEFLHFRGGFVIHCTV